MTATAGGVEQPTVAPGALANWWRTVSRAPELKRLAVLVAVLGLFGVLNPNFLGVESFVAILQATAFVGIVAIGQTMLIVAGEFDLSVGSVAALSSVSAALLMTTGGLDPFVAMAAGIVIGALVGLVNSVLVLKVAIPSFIATIGMLFIVRGLTVYISHAKPIYPLPPVIHGMGDIKVGGISVSIVIFLGLVVVCAFILNRTTFGRLIRATGGNPDAARIAGVKTVRIKVVLFVFVGILASCAGMLSIMYFGSGTSTTGTGWELSAIAAVVVGGTSLFGGSGTVVGTLLGLLILQSISNGMVAAQIDPWWQTITIGVIMLLSVSVDLVRRRRRPIV